MTKKHQSQKIIGVTLSLGPMPAFPPSATPEQKSSNADPVSSAFSRRYTFSKLMSTEISLANSLCCSSPFLLAEWLHLRAAGNPLQCSCPENPTDRGAWRVTVHGVAKSGTRLNNSAQHSPVQSYKGASVTLSRHPGGAQSQGWSRAVPEHVQPFEVSPVSPSKPGACLLNACFSAAKNQNRARAPSREETPDLHAVFLRL